MERILINVKHESFLVEFELKNFRYEGVVYPIDIYKKPSGEQTYVYQSKTSSNLEHQNFNEDCKTMFSFIFTLRGVWEGRIYFEEDEYWAEELVTMAELWDKIKVALVAFRKSNKQ